MTSAALATQRDCPSAPTAHILELRRSYDPCASVADQEQKIFPGISSVLRAVSTAEMKWAPVPASSSTMSAASDDAADRKPLCDGTSILPCGTMLDADGNVIGTLELEVAN